MQAIETDYLVVGAGAMGMAFTDALIDHADVHVTLVDKRPAPGGHWRDAYPFVQLHQASPFYGVASTPLGQGEIQSKGPEAGLQSRARQPEVLAYYDDILHRQLIGSGRVTFLGGYEHRAADGRHRVTSLESGETVPMNVRRRVVDATYLSPSIPAITPPPFRVADDVDVVPVNDIVRRADARGDFVIVGSGKTATDAIVWLLANGVAPGRIVWVRPRDPWMLNRAKVQPNPVSALSLAADIMNSAIDARTADEMFLRLEAAGVMLRIDRDRVPTMARAPTLGQWELDLLRTVERVVRLGHILSVDGREIVLDKGTHSLEAGTIIVHCAASGLRYPPRTPIWAPDRILLQTIRAGAPCFAAALAGYVEATRSDDEERNRLCPANRLPNYPSDWIAMHARGALAARAFTAEPDIAAWANRCLLNPARVDPSCAGEPEVVSAAARLAGVLEQGLESMIGLSGLAADS